LQKNLHGLP